MDLPSSSPQRCSSFSVRRRCPLSARGGTRCRWAGILAAVQACQRSSTFLGLTTGLRLHLEQLVANACRRLEVEIRRRFPHLCLELGDQRRQIILAVVRARLSDTAALLPLALLTLGTRVRHTSDETNLIDTLLDAHWRDAVLPVVRPLQLATTTGLLNAALHRAGHLIGVEDGASAQMSGSSA